jgi:hypothetical protein
MNYLLIRFAYPPLSGYGQFEKAYTLKPGEDLELTIGPSPFTPDWKLMKKSEVYNNIYILMPKYLMKGDCENEDEME